MITLKWYRIAGAVLLIFAAIGLFNLGGSLINIISNAFLYPVSIKITLEAIILLKYYVFFFVMYLALGIIYLRITEKRLNSYANLSLITLAIALGIYLLGTIAIVGILFYLGENAGNTFYLITHIVYGALLLVALIFAIIALRKK